VDLYRTIRTLHEERKRLEKLIESLEQLQATENGIGQRNAPGRRGRKGMSADERRKVSERMKKYWAARRGVSGQPGSQASAATTGTA
jgi:hypothetical protein